MFVEELREALGQFNPSAPLIVAIPSLSGPHQMREVHLAGHLGSPGQVQTDHTVHALDIVCDHWDLPGRSPREALETVGDLLAELQPYPDEMHARVAVPVATATHSHRMLDIVMLGHAVGDHKGVQIITENWDNLMQVIKELPHLVEARQAEYERLAVSMPPGEPSQE